MKKLLLIIFALFFVACSQTTPNLPQNNQNSVVISSSKTTTQKKSINYDNKLMLACENLNENACFEIGKRAYGNADYHFALEAYDRACHYKFHIPSCRAVALMFENGVGVEKNINNSLEIYSTACFRGHKESCDDMKRLEKGR